MNFSDHQKQMDIYTHSKSGNLHQSDIDELKKHHQFIRDDEVDEKNINEWGVRMARR